MMEASADIPSELATKGPVLTVRVRWGHLGLPCPGSLHSLVGDRGRQEKNRGPGTCKLLVSFLSIVSLPRLTVLY